MSGARVIRAALRGVLFGALASCGGAGDSAAIDSALCGDAPVLTWENFGQGFLTENCQTCHASAAPDRNGAPSAVTFDDKDESLALADQILARASGDDADMPPEGGVADEERLKLEIWLSCWE